MDLLKTLKQFKNIEPDRGYTKRSRGLILNSLKPKPAFSFWSITLKNIEAGASLALAGLLVFLIIGGLSALEILSPLPQTALDPAALRAEADAIDIQIQLAGLDYEEGEAPALRSGGESTVSAAPEAPSDDEAPEEDKPHLSVDEALELLSQ